MDKFTLEFTELTNEIKAVQDECDKILKQKTRNPIKKFFMLREARKLLDQAGAMVERLLEMLNEHYS